MRTSSTIPSDVQALRPAIPRYPQLALARAERSALVDLLVWAVSADFPRDNRPSPALPSRDADRLWAAVPALAEGHGVAALAAPLLVPIAPDSVARQIEDAAARTLARGERMAQDAARIARSLGDAGVPFAWSKGAWLAPRLYERPAVRPLADLDLLVPPVASESVARVLGSLGYVEAGRTWKHRAFLPAGNSGVVDLRGEHPDNPRPVEVHTRLGESFRGIDLDWTAALRLDRPAVELPAALGLAHLAAHATVDLLGRRARLIQSVDLALQADCLDDVGWRAFTDLAGSPHAARFVWPALALAARTLGAPVPVAVLAALEAETAPALRAWVAHVDLDALSYFGRDTAPRGLGEIPAIWPRTTAERAAVWRFILLPGRWQLADRYPRLARSRAWPLIYARHCGYTAGRLVARWRQRG